jgi:hypothetical protein
MRQLTLSTAEHRWELFVLDETAHQSLLGAIDVAISRCVDAFNIASEAGEPELADSARVQVTELKAFREAVLARPTRRARWQYGRSPRGDARSR